MRAGGVVFLTARKGWVGGGDQARNMCNSSAPPHSVRPRPDTNMIVADRVVASSLDLTGV